MTGLFFHQQQQARRTPLADRLRPTTLQQVLGQEALIGEHADGDPGPLKAMVDKGQLTSLLFWGPPGVGKTTLARLLAAASGYQFTALSAVSSGVKELRETIAQAETTLGQQGLPTVLFIDEIHRYSKPQQDALLPYVENGTLTLMGATTENPSFQVASALLSRLLVFKLAPLSRENLQTLLGRAIQQLIKENGHKVAVQKEAMEALIHFASGDGRSALTLLEACYLCAPKTPLSPENPEPRVMITLALVEKLAQQNRLHYDNGGDEHYDCASAYQKSMRGGDADAALYWLAKMIASGEDPRFIARRLVICAAEDVGLADPQAFILAQNAAAAVEKLGLPEGRIPLALATAYVARAPKSNHAYTALDAALNDITQNGQNHPVPLHLKDAHYEGAKAYGHGIGYTYTHSAPQVVQTFLPEPLLGKRYLQWPE